MPFDLDTFLATPRAGGLALSPTGDRLVTTVGSLGPDGTSFVTALWELDPAGSGPPRRLTRSAPGESAPVFTPAGDLLFTSKRPDPAVKDPDDEVPALWLLPAGGEARPLASTPAGVAAVRVARDAGTVVLATDVFPAAESLDADRERAKHRKDAKVVAVLFDEYPIRYWDHELGPRETRLYVADPPGSGDADAGLALTELTPEAGRALDNATFDVTPDGRTVVTSWITGDDLHSRSPDLVAIEVSTGELRTLAAGDAVFHSDPACSPDGRYVVCVRERAGDPDRADEVTLLLVDLASGEGRDLTPDLDRWPAEPVWAPDSAAVYFCADDAGHRPVFRVELATGEVTRLCRGGAYHDVRPAPDGRSVFAMRSSVGTPAQAVLLAADAVDQEPTLIPTPGSPVVLPGRVEELTATADDGTAVHSWLVLPHDASPERPAPLVVFIHGGPLSSWNDWSWRWSPHLLAEHGYAVLLPDPALSTGYGQDFIQRGWGRWGGPPYTDLMSAVDAAVARPDIDETRTAAMGGSFGGYLANWVAGHTDRFRCIVTHASLWALDQFHGTTDNAVYWEYVFGDPYQDPTRYRENSPHLHIGDIRTPMLVIHGENDDRVPIGEALRLYTDLKRHGVESQFLLFPDENHWVLKPNNTRVWYETVLAFLGQHVLGKDFTRPGLL